MLRRMKAVFSLAAAGAALALAGAAHAACLDAPELSAYQSATSADFALGPVRSDRLGRVIAPVTVNGEGPFRFIVDTGANRSVLSAALAQRLGLVPSGQGEVHSVHSVTTAPLVSGARLQYGEMSLSAAPMPVLQGAVLAGAHGLLGVDGMSGRRLRLDFDRNCIEILPSREARRLRNWVAVRGELRFGHLVVVRGNIGGVRTNLLLDTGSDSSLANDALREALNARVRRNRPVVEYTFAYTAGDRVTIENAMIIRRMTMGDLEMRNVTAYVGDFHIFSLWQMLEEPTLLVGMDVLSQARGLAIDYSTAMVYLRPRPDRNVMLRISR